MNKMRLFYRKKGKYKDGRDRIVIEDRDNKKSVTLPKPELLIKILRVPLVVGIQVSKSNKEK